MFSYYLSVNTWQRNWTWGCHAGLPSSLHLQNRWWTRLSDLLALYRAASSEHCRGDWSRSGGRCDCGCWPWYTSEWTGTRSSAEGRLRVRCVTSRTVLHFCFFGSLCLCVAVCFFFSVSLFFSLFCPFSLCFALFHFVSLFSPRFSLFLSVSLCFAFFRFLSRCFALFRAVVLYYLVFF